MDKTDRSAAVPGLPDEAEYPPQLTENYELLECLSDQEGTRTLLASARAGGALCVVKCYLTDSPLFQHAEPDALRDLDAPPMPRFVAEYRSERMRCVLRDYVPGETLFHLGERQRFSEEDVIRIGAQLCSQLNVLHTLQPPVIHRDIKPQNVVIRPDGTAVLIDFGIARARSEKDADTVALGTRGFAPPEQYGFASTDARSDIYSLGVLLYWLICRDTAVPRAGGTALEKILARCTCFDPEKRFSDIGQVRHALLAARPQARKRRRRMLSLVCVLLLSLAAVWTVSAVRGREHAVRFSEPLIEQAVRLNLGLSDDEPVTDGLLERVTAVYIVSDAAYPDADSFYPAISSWYARGRPERGPITALGDLAALPNLEQVCIAAQELTDISALAGLSRLSKAELKHNFITDISALAGMERLTSVGINDNPVRDISPLASCPNLAFLDLCDVRSYEPSPIAQLGNFDFLDISNPTGSYRWLDGKSILDLRIAWSGLDDLHYLDHVTRLERLEIDHTHVTDLSPLSLHRGLKLLRLAGLPVTDFRVLTELPQLEQITVSEEQRPGIEALGSVSFRVIYE